MKEIIEKVAAGLRKMNKKPDYLLFIDGLYENFTWGEDSICGIPVIHTDMAVNSGYDSINFFFHPCWSKEQGTNYMDVYYFQRGFAEYNSLNQTL